MRRTRRGGLCLLALRQLVQNIGGLVHPTALTAGLWPNLLERLPEPECTVGNREPDRKPPSSQIEEHFLPGLCALADTLGETDELLFALPVGGSSMTSTRDARPVTRGSNNGEVSSF